MTRPATATLLFDFDGTVALGDGPLRAYAREVAARADASVAEDLLAAIELAWDAPQAELLDGYDLVRSLALARGVPAESLSAGYLASRRALGTPLAPIVAPEGLSDFLDGIAGRARRVLATNAPATRIPEALDALGLAGRFDLVRTSVGKPEGLAPLIAELLADGPVLSIGDVWHNDLEPAARLGAATALVAPAGYVPADAAPDYRAERLPDLYDPFHAWLDGAAAGSGRPAPQHP